MSLYILFFIFFAHYMTAIGALAPKTISKNSWPLHPIPAMYHSILPLLLHLYWYRYTVCYLKTMPVCFRIRHGDTSTSRRSIGASWTRTYFLRVSGHVYVVHVFERDVKNVRFLYDPCVGHTYFALSMWSYWEIKKKCQEEDGRLEGFTIIRVVDLLQIGLR